MSDAPLAIRVEGVSRYVGPLYEMDGVNRPRETWRSLMRLAGLSPSAGDDPEVTHAVGGHVLRDVTLDIAQGSVVCLMPPGDESTALLEVLAGVTIPTSGRAEIYAPVTALLAVGDNLDGRMTAYENILALPELAGASDDEKRRRVQEVLDFAGLHGFEHVAIRTFSTGMEMRLSVALALCGRPSIVLIDDVLAVGDIEFQQRCIDRVRELKDAGCTLLLAFSDEGLVRRMATRVISLAGGTVVGDSDPASVAAHTVRQTGDAEWHVHHNLPENDVIALRAVTVAAGHDSDGTFLDLYGSFETKAPRLRCRPVVSVAAPRGVLFRGVYPAFVEVVRPGPLGFGVRVPTGLLRDGVYSVGFHMASVEGSNVFALKATSAVTLTIRRGEPPAPEDAAVPLLMLPFRWDVNALAEAST
jgi:ABC-type polysaccharide/polyol phosphate transport system ATPase subunit